MESIEKTGETVEEAIAAGLAELGVEPYDVMVEVLEEPSRGLLGVGATPARVRLVVMGGARQQTPPPSPPSPPSAAPVPSATDNPSRSQESQPPRQRSEKRRPPKAPVEFDYDDDEDFDIPATPVIAEEDADELARVGKEVLLAILERMGLDATILIHRADSTRAGEDTHWVLNITGDNINRLIGHRGETLTSLQYITRLIVSRRLQRRANIIVDAADYKARRSERLKQLAHRMADQAIRQKRTIKLEPMPPHERRIVHLALRSREDVVTKSIGEGKGRKVTIAPVE